MTLSDTSGLVGTVAGLQSASTQQSIGIAVARQQIRQEQAVATLVAEVANAAAPSPAPGTGLLVDRKA
jgi:hypothetical protein